MTPYIKLLGQIIRPEDIQSIPKNQLVGGDNGTISSVLQLVFGIAGAAALIIIMIGALKYVTSQGNPQAVTKAKDTILYAVIGLVICIMAFSIVTFVLDSL